MAEDLNQLRKDTLAGLPNSRRSPSEGEPIRPGGMTKAKGRVTPSGVFVSTHDIVESIRPLLNDAWTDGDIKRAMARKFGGKGVSFRKHIALARKRNREAIGQTREDAKAGSVGNWSRQIAENRQKRARAEQQLPAELAKLAQAREAFEQAGPATLEFALVKLNMQRAFVADVRRDIATAESNIVSSLHTLDTILGNKSPIEYVDTTDRKNELAHPAQPLTDKESDALLASMLGKIREAVTSEVRQEVSQPSEN